MSVLIHRAHIIKDEWYEVSGKVILLFKSNLEDVFPVLKSLKDSWGDSDTSNSVEMSLLILCCAQGSDNIVKGSKITFIQVTSVVSSWV